MIQLHYPFLWRFYRSHRAILFQILKQVQLRSTTQDKSIEASIQFLIDHQGSRMAKTRISHFEKMAKPHLEIA